MLRLDWTAKTQSLDTHCHSSLRMTNYSNLNVTQNAVATEDGLNREVDYSRIHFPNPNPDSNPPNFAGHRPAVPRKMANAIHGSAQAIRRQTRGIDCR